MNRYVCEANDDRTADAITDAVMAQICIEPKTDNPFSALHKIINPLHKIAPDMVKHIVTHSDQFSRNMNNLTKGINLKMQGKKR